MEITKELKDWWFNIFDHLFEMFPNGGIYTAARRLNGVGHPPKEVVIFDGVDDLLELLKVYIMERNELLLLSGNELLNRLI